MESDNIGSKTFSWSDINWIALQRLRERFLDFEERKKQGETASGSDYWRSHSELESYDFTYAERIGWKWDTLLTELRVRGWTLPGGPVLDYGCGTGVAGRRVVEWAADPGVDSPPANSKLASSLSPVSKLLLCDRSQPAMRFALGRARACFPQLPVEMLRPTETAQFSTLVISHVINELSPVALGTLLALASRATAVLWVEPGTAAVSRALIAARERLLTTFRPIAPCTHAAQCGMLAVGNEHHWCHHFAKPPASVFQDSGWGHFARILEIDLASVPFSCLVLDRRPQLLSAETPESRVIGVPREYKGFAKVLSCQEDGVIELILQKRDSPELFKEMRKDPGSLYRWVRDGDKIRGGTRIAG